VNENRDIVSKNKVVFSGFQASLDELKRKDGELRTTADKVEGQLKTLSASVSDTSNQLTTSRSVTNGIGNLVSVSLSVPLILTGPNERGGDQSLEGKGFGTEVGKLYVRVAPVDQDLLALAGLPFNLSAQPDTLDVPLKTWSDDRIVFSTDTFNSLVASAISARRSLGWSLEFQVQTAAGTKSNVYQTISPRPPVGLGISVQ
jgi:hypothetical protein